MEIDKENYLSKFKVDSVGNLFGMDWETFNKEGRCPICTRKLYEMRNRPMRYCKNRLHKRFIAKIK